MTNNILAQPLKEARLQRGLTQVQLAELTGLSQVEISRIEGGQRQTSIRLASKIAEALGMKITLIAQ